MPTQYMSGTHTTESWVETKSSNKSVTRLSGASIGLQRRLEHRKSFMSPDLDSCCNVVSVSIIPQNVAKDTFQTQFNRSPVCDNIAAD